MAEYTVNLTGNIDKKATGDAVAVRALRAEIKGLQADLKAVGGMQSIMRGAGAARAGAVGRGGVFGALTDGWSRQQAAADRYTSSMGKAQAQAIAMDRRRSELAQRQATRAAAQEAREAERFSAYRIRLNRKEHAENERAAKRAAAAAERAAHRSYYGGEKSLGGLFRKRADHKMNNFATGAADAILDAPGRIVSGALGGIGSAVVGTAEMAYNLGKAAISAQAMREESVDGFNAIFKSTTAGDRLLDAARTVAKRTKFETPQVIARFNALGGRGFGENQIERIYSTISDVETGRKYLQAQRYQNALANINATSIPTWQQFKQGADASGGTILAVPEIGKRLGINATGAALELAVRKRFKDRKVSSMDAMEALIAGTNARYNPGGKEGDFAAKQGEGTWSGTISNIASGLGDVLNMKLPADHAINKFKGILQAIGSPGGLFDQTSVKGQRFEKLISAFVTDVFLPFGGMQGKTDDLLDNLMTAAEAVEVRFKEVMTDIKRAVDAALGDPGMNALECLAGMVAWAVAKGALKGLRDGLLPQWLQHPGDTLAAPFKSDNWKAANLQTNLSQWLSPSAKVDGGEMVRSETVKPLLGGAGSGMSSNAVYHTTINMPDMPEATATEIAETGGKMAATAHLRQMDVGMRMRVASGGL